MFKFPIQCYQEQSTQLCVAHIPTAAATRICSDENCSLLAESFLKAG